VSRNLTLDEARLMAGLFLRFPEKQFATGPGWKPAQAELEDRAGSAGRQRPSLGQRPRPGEGVGLARGSAWRGGLTLKRRRLWAEGV